MVLSQDFISILQNVTFYQLLSIITDLTIEDTNTSTDAGNTSLLSLLLL
jgi:hypothetical protein